MKGSNLRDQLNFCLGIIPWLVSSASTWLQATQTGMSNIVAFIGAGQ